MESTGTTLTGAGTFRCEDCGHVVALPATEALQTCPSCGGRSFARSSLFGATRFPRRADRPADERSTLLAEARERAAGRQALAVRDGDELRVFALDRAWTRIGRALAAEIRFDDPTVSRRHALVACGPDGVRVLDDRSLNGVYVNGERVPFKALQDGDEVVVGRHRLVFVDGEPAAPAVGAAAEPAPL